MSFTPEPGTPLAAYYTETQPRTGAILTRRSLGTLDAGTNDGRVRRWELVGMPSARDPHALRIWRSAPRARGARASCR
jgi:hypothetical protein